MDSNVLAFDFGASSGRAVIGHYDGNTIRLEEVHRFENIPVRMYDTFFWDLPFLFNQIKTGLVNAAKICRIDSVGVDTWGVDFGLIDDDGHIMENPVHYRDRRTEGILSEAFELIGREDLYGITGNQIMEINTAFQLLSLKKSRASFLRNAKKMLLTPDLFNYLLTGKMKSEMSISSTTQLLNINEKIWADEVIHAFGIPRRLLPEIIPSGTVIGPLRDSICNELNIPQTKVTAVCGHDTQCAVVAAPTDERDFIFISCGTWSLFGTETDSPIVDNNSAAMNLTNEIGWGGKTTFLKNIIGLWLIQESRRQFKRDGKEYSYADLEKLALAAEPFRCFIDADAPEFVPDGNIPERAANYCKATAQKSPRNVGETMRCIYESLAMKYRMTFDEIKLCTGKSYNKIHLIGGGAKDSLLCQMTANACGCQVYAGPIEATAYGNIAVQLMANGTISDINEARKIISASEKIKIYRPCDEKSWDENYNIFKKIIMK